MKCISSKFKSFNPVIEEFTVFIMVKTESLKALSILRPEIESMLVKTDNEATELIVPAHHPIKCACTIKAKFKSKFFPVKTESKKVEEITGCIPIIETNAIDNGIKIKTNHSGIKRKYSLQLDKSSELLFETK